MAASCRTNPQRSATTATVPKRGTSEGIPRLSTRVERDAKAGESPVCNASCRQQEGRLGRTTTGASKGSQPTTSATINVRLVDERVWGRGPEGRWGYLRE